MRTFLIKKIAVSLGIFFGIANIASAFTFDNNFGIGFYGNDVYELQRFLNTDQETVISAVGAGSPQNETFYFGKLTQEALKKFQKKYSNEILAPAGLQEPTGFLGIYTRKKINELVNKTLNVEINNDNTQIGASNPISEGQLQKLPQIKPPLINSLSNINIIPETEVIIYGENFTGKEKVYWGEEELSILEIDNQKNQIKIKAPDKLGVFLISVKNDISESKYYTPIYIVVTEQIMKEGPANFGLSNIEDVKNIVKGL